EVQRPGFLSWSRDITLEPGDRQSLEVQLLPSPAYARERERRMRARRVTGGALGATGVGLGIATTVLAFWNHDRFTDWERTQEELDDAWEAGTPYPEDQFLLQDDNDGLARSVHRYDVVTVGLGVGAAAAVAASVVTLVTGDTPVRRQRFALHGGPDLAAINWRASW
ncbi:MAG TPA: hypothetical protein PLU22_07120, partial [Polyangiaceae bacterium]|nr:hypothetical protein [Polyangiaceae bacterium]